VNVDHESQSFPWFWWALFLALCVLLAVAGGVVWDLLEVLRGVYPGRD
jgi:hypothetical protein